MKVFSAKFSLCTESRKFSPSKVFRYTVPLLAVGLYKCETMKFKTSIYQDNGIQSTANLCSEKELCTCLSCSSEDKRYR